MNRATSVRLVRIDMAPVSRALCVDWDIEPNSDPDQPEGVPCNWSRGWISDNRRTNDLARAHTKTTGHVVEVQQLKRSKIQP